MKAHSISKWIVFTNNQKPIWWLVTEFLWYRPHFTWILNFRELPIKNGDIDLFANAHKSLAGPILLDYGKKLHSCTFRFGIPRQFIKFSLSLFLYFQYCTASILKLPLNKNIAGDYYATFSRDFGHQIAILECWQYFQCILALFINILWLIISWFRHRLHFEKRDFRVVFGAISDLSDEPPYLSTLPW